MTVHTKTNQYQGVNAHLHSYFQSKGGWSSFHTNHIADLARAINAILPPGYLVDVEQSLQIREFHPDTGERIRKPEPDITIYDTERKQPRQGNRPPGGAVATVIQPVAETLELDEDQYYPAVVVYQTEDDATLGSAVTRIELLSPSNKAGDGYLQYREKRAAALKSGVRLVEIDYLHESRSPVKNLPLYPQQPNSFAYNITVSDPIPSLERGLAETYGFGVDDPIPTIAIPLADDDLVLVDFGAVYNQTFESLTAYSRRVDYAELPEHFHTYSPADQARIRARMQAVVEGQR